MPPPPALGRCGAIRRSLAALVLLACLPLAGGGPATGGSPGATPPLRVGQPYREARIAMGQAGWTPRPRPAGLPCAALVPDRRCQLYPELQSCSQTGPGFCRFEWLSPLGVPLAVVTRGGDVSGDPGVLSTWFVLP